MIRYLYIEAYVHVALKANGLLFYNFLNQESLCFSENDKVYSFFTQKGEELNQYLIDITDDLFILKDFIEVLRDKYMGDVIIKETEDEKPVITVPFVKDLAIKDINRSLGDQLMELTIYLTDECSFSCKICGDAWKQFPFCSRAITNEKVEVEFFITQLKEIINRSNLCRINLLGGDLLSDPLAIELIEFLKDYNITIYLYVHYKHLSNIRTLDKFNNVNWVILFDAPPQISPNLGVVKDIPMELLLVVQSEEDMEGYKNLLTTINLPYFYVPYYSGSNLAFFEEYVFLDKEDILSSSFTENDFLQHSLINSHSFGKLYILPNGEIRVDLSDSPIGTIQSDVKEIIYKELNTGKNWKNIRSQLKPCNDCVFELLCPSPGYLEKELRSNTCNIFVDS